MFFLKNRIDFLAANAYSFSASGRSPEVASQSAIAALIPGVRNMKTIRRSLGAALLRKYIGMANKPRVDHLQQPSH